MSWSLRHLVGRHDLRYSSSSSLNHVWSRAVREKAQRKSASDCRRTGILPWKHRSVPPNRAHFLVAKVVMRNFLA
eukprot:3051970-Amphidinium_carterae.1